MKKNKLLSKLLIGGAIVLSTFSGCAPMLKTYRSPRYIGNFVESTTLATGNALVETDSMHLVAKDHLNAQPGDSCYATFDIRYDRNGRMVQVINLDIPKTDEKHQIKGKERNY